jgi:4-hydroxybenzoate polyprenyltransferase
MTAILALIRPQQWIKNVVVLAGVVFAERLGDPELVVRALAAFATFCIVSSGTYVFNDLIDADRDRLHPEKRLRPIAAGTVGKGTATVLFLLLWGGGVALGFQLGARFGATCASYVALNLLYTLWLKHHVIIDVMGIAVGFMMRAIGGVAVLRDVDPGVTLSQWLLLCTFFLALVMGFGKRRSELRLLDESASRHRAALGDYSTELLDSIIPMVSTAAILAYSIYTIWPQTVAKLGTDKLVYTVPFVVYGFFRYQFLIRERGLGGNPSEILFRDVALAVSVVAWMVAIVVVLYLR